MGFNESEEYKKIFISSGVGTGSVQVLQGVEFELEPQKDHTFEVEPLRNVGQGASSQKVISKWKAGLKEEMDAWSNLYVLNNDGMVFLASASLRSELPRVCWIKFYNGKLVQTLLEGHSILSLDGSLSGDCDVEKNGKWSCIYAVGSQEYRVVCTRLDIASLDVGMLDKFDRGLHTDVQVFVDFDYAMGRSITSGVHDTYGGCKGGYLAKETRNRVRIRAKDSSGYCYSVSIPIELNTIMEQSKGSDVDKYRFTIMEQFKGSDVDKYRCIMSGEGEKNTTWKYGAPANYDAVNNSLKKAEPRL
ncbi:hypothetical protein Tco_0450791 [Tanacetum coccineum]